MLALVSRSFAVVAVLVALTACSGEVAKDATSKVVGKAIEVGKGTATGIAAGVEEGRKNAESADGAVIVSNAAELAKTGSMKLEGVTANGDAATVAVLFENTGDKPLRVTKIDVLALDTAGVVVPTTPPGTEVTVPAHAKTRYAFGASAKADVVKTVRVYGQDVTK